jgi:hypothetical protein
MKKTKKTWTAIIMAAEGGLATLARRASCGGC